MKKKKDVKKKALHEMKKQKQRVESNLEEVQKRTQEISKQMVEYTNETFETLEKAKADQIKEAPIEFDKNLPFFARIFKFMGKDIGRIFRIFGHDIKKLFTNFTAIVIAIGVMLLPSLYAWFNIMASWDPYGRTGSLSVAVANEDAGASLAGIQVDVGGEIVNSLKGNDQIGWVFVNKKEAKRGVESGKYYAAVVIPRSFSMDMLSMLQDELKRPQLNYYVNEKKNAIAPKITNSGVNVVQKMVNEAFIQQAVQAFSGVIQQVNNEVAGTDIEEKVSEGMDLSAIDDTIKLLEQTKDTIDILDATSVVYSSSGETVDELLGEISDLLKDTEKSVDEADKKVEELKGNAKNAKQSIEVVVNGMEKYISLVKTGSGTLEDKIDSAVKGMDQAADKSYQEIIECKTMVYNLNSILSEVVTTLTKLEQYTTKTSLKKEIDKLKDMQKKLTNLSTKLTTVEEKIQNGKKVSKSDLNSAKESIIAIKKGMTEAEQGFMVTESFVDEITGNISELNEILGNSVSGIEKTVPNIQKTIKATRKTLKSTGTSVESVKSLVGIIDKELGEQIEALNGTKKELRKIEKNVNNFLAGEWQIKLEEKYGITLPDLTSDTSELAEFLSAPVKLNNVQIFPIENYGSALSPFYTILCLWVGGLVLVSILKVKVKEDDELSLKGYRQYNLYYGRYMIFMVFAIIQAVIVCLGDLYLLGIQCLHPGLFILAGVFASIVFSNIVYTLTLSFGDVGKAVAVVLLVLQVAGAGGTFPIECTPEFFQVINPLLPFTHGINAMREAVGGLYGDIYWMSILKMVIYLPIFLVFGTVLRKPILWLNDFFTRRLEDTEIM